MTLSDGRALLVPRWSNRRAEADPGACLPLRGRDHQFRDALVGDHRVVDFIGRRRRRSSAMPMSLHSRHFGTPLIHLENDVPVRDLDDRSDPVRMAVDEVNFDGRSGGGGAGVSDQTLSKICCIEHTNARWLTSEGSYPLG